MKKQFFLPLMTYPDQTSDSMIGNALDLARNCVASLHAAAVEIIIPPITDPWASLLIDTGRMVRDAEQASAERAGRLRNIVATRAAASAEVMTGKTSNSTMSSQFAIQASIKAPSSVSIN